MDPNENALSLAKQRYLNISNPNDKNKISYFKDSRDLPGKLDIAIISTTSNVRRNIIESLLDKFSIKYLILEKVVFQKSKDFKFIQNLFLEKGVKVWVNCARRSYPFYKKIKNELVDGKISIKVMGNDWGLACNGIHMIDLLAFLSGEKEFIFNIGGLEKTNIDSKRKGYKELKGTLKIQTSRGDILVLNDSDKYNENLKISISNGSMQFNIYEGQGMIVKHTSDNERQEEKISIPFQSDLTGSIVDQILDTGESDLTPYDECMQYHVPMLDAFNAHISILTGKLETECPIT